MPEFAPEIASALDFIEEVKAGFVPPFLTTDELAELNLAWESLYNDPDVNVSNKRFIIDPKMYTVPSFARLATHPVVQEIVRRTIGPFQLAGYAVVATPPYGSEPSTPLTTAFHSDHIVYSDVPVAEARDTFVCVWVNLMDIEMENGPFALAVGTHKWNIDRAFFNERPSLTVQDMGMHHLAGYNTGPAGSTAVYSGKTWHSATVNCSDKVRRGLNMNFVPHPALDTKHRNEFDVCGLSPEQYTALESMIGVPGYLIRLDEPFGRHKK